MTWLDIFTFNSTMVRLKVHFGSNTRILFRAFNSTMVRLKGEGDAGDVPL